MSKKFSRLITNAKYSDIRWSGWVAETTGLLNRRTLNGVPRVRIPPSPQDKKSQFRKKLAFCVFRRYLSKCWLNNTASNIPSSTPFLQYKYGKVGEWLKPSRRNCGTKPTYSYLSATQLWQAGRGTAGSSMKYMERPAFTARERSQFRKELAFYVFRTCVFHQST